jgi:hypothetical protein
VRIPGGCEVTEAVFPEIENPKFPDVIDRTQMATAQVWTAQSGDQQLAPSTTDARLRFALTYDPIQKHMATHEEHAVVMFRSTSMAVVMQPMKSA